MTRLLAIADDLTGALEVGALFAASGLPAAVGVGGIPEGDCAVVDAGTRHAPPEQAEATVAALAAGWRGLVYKKTDSTLRGNIGAELRALHALFGGPIAYVPAYPAMGRTVKGGALYVDGTPVERTEFARDALNPVLDGRVRSLVDPACECVVFDGETGHDVERAAAEILSSRAYPVVAGPAAIAGALAAALGAPAKVVWPAVRRCLVWNGSRHPASARQVRCALDTGVISTEDDAAWRLGRAAIAEGTAPLEAAREAGRAVVRLLAERPCDALAVFGGDTAFGVLAALGLPVLNPVGEALPGVPAARIRGRHELLIAKAGGFGAPDLLARLRSGFDASGR